MPVCCTNHPLHAAGSRSWQPPPAANLCAAFMQRCCLQVAEKPAPARSIGNVRYSASFDKALRAQQVASDAIQAVRHAGQPTYRKSVAFKDTFQDTSEEET